MAKKKRTKRRKKPPNAKKGNPTQLSVEQKNTEELAIAKLKEIWPSDPDFNFNDEIIRGLDAVAVSYRNADSKDFSILFRLMFVSERLLRSYLGDVWVDRNLWGRKEGKDIASFGQNISFEGHKFLDRTIAFTEMLYNFQNVDGIREKARLLQNEDIESALAELEGAQMLFASGRKIKFTVPSNVKTQDFDVETYLADGTPVACEMKCKFELTEFSSKTIKKTITKGGSQLPKDIPGVLFVKLPEYWITNENFMVILKAGVNEAFNQTKTVSVVVFHWEIWKELGDRGANRVIHLEIKANPNARFDDPEIKRLVEPPLTSYKRLYEIVGIKEVRFEP